MRTENLAIVFIDIAGFTPRTSAQTREENLRMLRRFDELVRPLVRAYNGRVVKTMGDAFLLTFRSPTEALLCSTAIHDRIAESDCEVDPSERFVVRAAVNAGDVRIQRGDVFGEAVNIAARIEGQAGAGDIYFSESVYLSMTRTEVPSEEVGYAELKGIPGRVRLYRVPRSNEAKSAVPKGAGSPACVLPYGGLGLERVRDGLTGINASRILTPAVDHAWNILSTVSQNGQHSFSRLYAWWKKEIMSSRLVQFGTMLVLLGFVWLMVWLLKPKPKTPWQKFQRLLGF
jgi:adenylate cyclase